MVVLIQTALICVTVFATFYFCLPRIPILFMHHKILELKQPQLPTATQTILPEAEQFQGKHTDLLGEFNSILSDFNGGTDAEAK